jgi:nicotinate dehydrogenase subunit A
MRLVLNRHSVSVDAKPDTPLLYVLRNDFGLNGPKYGCGLGECGACTVLVDGAAARSCVLPVAAVEGRSVTTLEGLAIDGKPHPVQQAFIDEQAVQCGYCINGMIMTLAALLGHNPRASENELREGLRHNLCRCGTHIEIVAAGLRAVELINGERLDGGE